MLWIHFQRNPKKYSKSKCTWIHLTKLALGLDTSCRWTLIGFMAFWKHHGCSFCPDWVVFCMRCWKTNNQTCYSSIWRGAIQAHGLSYPTLRGNIPKKVINMVLHGVATGASVALCTCITALFKPAQPQLVWWLRTIRRAGLGWNGNSTPKVCPTWSVRGESPPAPLLGTVQWEEVPRCSALQWRNS